MIESNPSPGRIASLDGLRAISILMVMLFHSSQSTGFPVGLKDWIPPELGVVGVRVFFVISGFLITTLLLNEERKTGAINLMAFYRRRILRILPAYYFYIIAFAVLGLFVTEFSCPWSTYFSAASFTSLLWGYWGTEDSLASAWPLAHTWTLAVEEQFYILWPGLLILIPSGGGRRRALVVAALGLLLVGRIIFYHMGFTQHFLMEHSFINHADSIMFGCFLALASQRNSEWLKSVFRYRPMLLRFLAFALLMDTIYCDNFPFIIFHAADMAFTPTFQAIAIAFLVGSYVIQPSGAGYTLLNLRWLRALGYLSYSIYIWQQLFLAPAGNYATTYWWQQFPQNIFLTLAVGTTAYFLVEKPFLRFKARYSTSRKDPAAAVVQPVAPLPKRAGHALV